MLVCYNQRLYGKGGFSHHDVNQWGFTGAGTDYIMIRGLSAKLQANARGKNNYTLVPSCLPNTLVFYQSHVKEQRSITMCVNNQKTKKE